MKPGNTGLKRLVLAYYYSMKGLKAAWKNEAAFRQEIIVFIIACPLALVLPISLYEKLALVAPLVLLLIVELLNSAIEAVVDRIGSEHHDLSGRAKDMGSAAVLFSLILAFFTWACVLYSNF
ncbi:diacylglycerol kinase [Vibrio sp. F74]|uniref:diacylglycerol kinase n=1 Tax=Vibrio sp. F74 TaxID=700020 RepID=UPI0035F58691